MSICLKNSHFFIDALFQSGVNLFCIAPGSRSTSLVLAAEKYPNYVHFDERGLGFFALGFAKARGNIPAIIVTSGSAVANLLPAIMEAKAAEVPLLILSANRPLELWDCGSNQTTHQYNLFSSFVRWSSMVSLYDSNLKKEDLASIASYASFQGKKGPVHLDLLCREPFFSDTSSSLKKTPRYHEEKINKGEINVPKIRGKTLILVGEKQNPSPIVKWAEKCPIPILKDPLSNLPKNVGIADFAYRLKSLDRPDSVLHFGGRFVSKKLFLWMKDSPPNFYAAIGKRSNHFDPYRLITDHFFCEEASFCENVSFDGDKKYLASWKKPLKRSLNAQERYFEELGSLIPEHWGVFLGNSTVIRDASTVFFPKNATIIGNRGVSGIDGNVATTLGASKGFDRPFVGILGDLSFLHDSNSSALFQNMKHPVFLIVMNNQGGKIFERLPIAEKKDLLHKYFVANHPFSFEGIASSFQLPYFSICQLEDFTKTMKKIFSMKKSALIEIAL